MWSPETIVALTGVATVVMGGVELRLAVSRLAAKVDRIEERLGTVERERPQNPYAAYYPGE